MRETGDHLFLAYLKIQNLLKYKRLTMFCGIDIETTTVCNRKCKFCPNRYGNRGNREKIMKTSLFKKIIDDLGSINYDRRISPHFYGEPLLDRRMVSFVKYIRKKCPQALIQINSNGDYLNLALFKDLVKAGMDLLFITQYDGRVNKNVKDVLDWVDTNNRWYRRYIHVRVQNTFEDNRAGLIPQIEVIEEPLKEGCPRPSYKMAINWAGKVLLCCNDYYGKAIMGDINKEPLMKIWNSKKFEQVRKYLGNKNRSKIPLCKSCNYRADCLSEAEYWGRLNEHSFYFS